jgi:uncharacterized RDD family membrane protein YckC
MSISVPADSIDAAPGVSEESTRVSGRRFLAHFLDGLIFSVVAIIALIPLFVLVAVAPDSTIAMVIYILGLVAIFTVGHVYFLVLLHKKSGQSPGKKAAGIKVVDASGNVPTTSQLWKRFWPIVIEYIYLISWIGMMTSSHRQRFGDRWAGTYVVEA